MSKEITKEEMKMLEEITGSKCSVINMVGGRDFENLGSLLSMVENLKYFLAERIPGEPYTTWLELCTTYTAAVGNFLIEALNSRETETAKDLIEVTFKQTMDFIKHSEKCIKRDKN